ncbi:MAG TPA: GlsB/YeaQ/YmgE family stress response membrane protein, partial [Candidatus Baltobacteraceae bacterium]|nr:GlsB/YeaQ/YmgE family stress response membrane protein [Candidatus Baltobacteraceae bacterium]
TTWLRRGVVARRRFADAREENSMFHLLWYILIGLISGVIAKSVMHEHLTIFWTIVLGVIGSIIGGGVSHMFSRPANDRYHPAGLILSTLGAILVLYICFKLNIHFPQVNLTSR